MMKTKSIKKLTINGKVQPCMKLEIDFRTRVRNCAMLCKGGRGYHAAIASMTKVNPVIARWKERPTLTRARDRSWWRSTKTSNNPSHHTAGREGAYLVCISRLPWMLLNVGTIRHRPSQLKSLTIRRSTFLTYVTIISLRMFEALNWWTQLCFQKIRRASRKQKYNQIRARYDCKN